MIAAERHDMADFELQPTLRGQTLVLHPLAADDYEALFAVASDPLIWQQHPEPTRHQRHIFEKFFATGLESKGALLVRDSATGQTLGCSRYYEWDPHNRSVAIGYTFLARSHWGGSTNRELKQLMIQHAFRWAETVWFHIGKDNWRSRRAMEKIGGRLTHQAELALNGAVHEYAFYKIERSNASSARGLAAIFPTATPRESELPASCHPAIN
jgi:RimJ/RimL family protein N-acetyltransferase